MRTKILILVLVSLLIISACKGSTPTTPDVPQKPTINSFTSSLSEIKRGTSCTLSWDVTNATTVEIDNGIGQVSSSGSTTINPTDTTTYKLTATNSDGQTTRTCKVEVVNGADLVMISGPKWKEDDWTFSYFGIVKNNGTWKAEFVKVFIYLYKANSDLLDYDYSYVDKTNIAKGGQSPWDVTWWDSDKKIRNKVDKSKTEYEIEWSEYDFMARTGRIRMFQ